VLDNCRNQPESRKINTTAVNSGGFKQQKPEILAVLNSRNQTTDRE
jgi:hypothetical protein